LIYHDMWTPDQDAALIEAVKSWDIEGTAGRAAKQQAFSLKIGRTFAAVNLRASKLRAMGKIPPAKLHFREWTSDEIEGLINARKAGRSLPRSRMTLAGQSMRFGVRMRNCTSRARLRRYPPRSSLLLFPSVTPFVR
jgi:hypothetical protein